MRAWWALAAAAAAAGCSSAPAFPDLSAIPESDEFGEVAVGASSGTHRLALVNNGSAPSASITTGLTGPAAADFALVQDTCTGHPIGPGEGCNLLAVFTPTALGLRTASLDLTAAGSTFSIPLTGSGVNAVLLGLAPADTPYNYGPVLAGGPGATAVFVVSNRGGVASDPLSVESVNGFLPPDALMFVIGQDLCSGQSVPPGGSCSFAVTFRPPLSATGQHTTGLLVGGGVEPRTLMGTALHVASLAWSPPSHDYGIRQVSLDAADGDFTLQLSNQGNLDTSPVTVTASGGDFTVRATTCGQSGAFTLRPGASCDVTVRFVPAAAGSRSGEVRATALEGGALGVPAPLYGEGQWLLQVSKSGTGAGSVTSSAGGINCDTANADCSQLYDRLTTTTLTAWPALGSHFTGWTGCAPIAGRPLDCTLTLDGTGASGGAYTVTAGFDLD
ncbi:MAG TPA: choice-of-anchor D domain-containing protein [Myxococcales bacterium]|nr:choice-of-anchor D domain-containing protein [Myxococcales bacterium]